jgi:hypothetical protein
MRQNSQKQMPLTTGLPDHPRAKELVAMSAILDANPTINDLVFNEPPRVCRRLSYVSTATWAAAS